VAKKQTPDDEQQPGFEEFLAKLEQAVRQLEEGQLGLSESLECYEQGVKQLKQCYQALEVAERKIELLTGVDAAGQPVTEPFDEAEMSLEEKAGARSKRRSRTTSSDASASADEDDMDTPRRLF
jgi:exodeoxyribonuclease VII small subunit